MTTTQPFHGLAAKGVGAIESQLFTPKSKLTGAHGKRIGEARGRLLIRFCPRKTLNIAELHLRHWKVTFA